MGKKVTMLMILDGFGKNPIEEGNAVAKANKPNIDKLMMTCPTAEVYASGEAVGLPEGQMGNSEVGHTNIGARKNCLSRNNKNYKINRRRRLLQCKRI